MDLRVTFDLVLRSANPDFDVEIGSGKSRSGGKDIAAVIAGSGNQQNGAFVTTGQYIAGNISDALSGTAHEFLAGEAAFDRAAIQFAHFRC